MSAPPNISPIISFRKVALWLLHALVFSLPFFKKAIPPFIILSAVGIIVATVVTTSFKDWGRLIRVRIVWILLFSGLYLWYLVGMLYSANQPYGWFDLEIKLSLFLLPWLILGVPWLTPTHVMQLFRTFIWGLVTAILVCLVIAIVRFVGDGDPGHFSYAAFSFFHHPTYFSIYLNLGIAVLVHRIFTLKNKAGASHFLLIGLFIITIWQLSSRAGILCLGGLLAFTFLYFIFPRLKWVKSLLWLVGTVAVAAIIVSNSSYALTRFQTAGDALINQQADLRESSSAVRLAIWKESLNPIRQHWLLGVGTGDVKDELLKGYERAGLNKAQTKQLNAHNQFVQTQLAVGLPGLLLLLIGFLWPLWLSMRRRLLLYSMFLFIFGFNMLFESALEGQAGVVFYALMNALLCIGLLNPTEGNALRIPTQSAANTSVKKS